MAPPDRSHTLGCVRTSPGEWRGHARDSLNTDRVRFPWVGSTTFRGGRDDLCVPDDGPFTAETMAVRVLCARLAGVRGWLHFLHAHSGT